MNGIVCKDLLRQAEATRARTLINQKPASSYRFQAGVPLLPCL